MRWRIPTAYLSVGLLWGSSWLLASSFQSPWVGALIFCLAAVPPAIVFAVKRQRTRIVPSAILGAAMIGFPWILNLLAANYVSSSIVAVIGAMLPLLTLLASGEDASRIPILVAGVGGVALMLSQGLSISSSGIAGILLILLSLFWNTFALIYARRRLSTREIPASLAVQFLTAAAIAGSYGLLAPHDPHTSFSALALPMIVATALLVQSLGMAIYYWLLLRVESWQAASVQWVAILVSVVESAIAFHGRPSSEMYAGAALTLAAILWLFRSRNGSGSLTLEITSATFPERGASHPHYDQK
ncbi:DMT family transporter [Silvibacterium acidisoli]|uniref:DMT family transporter n=1 Tax=Acidobacteriaceae bacterium ZG23-2 TaxID=2883246 RepID=UPI00406D1F45